MGIVRGPDGNYEDASFLGYIPDEDLHPSLTSGIFGAFETDNGDVRILGVVPTDNIKGIRPSGKVKQRTYALKDGDAGIVQTLERMKKLALQDTEHPQIWELSRKIVGGPNPCPVRDRQCEMGRLLHWVQENIRWTPDIGPSETVARPVRTMGVLAGDCDDVSILLGSLGISIGIPTRFKAIAANQAFPEDFTHVYVQFRDKDGQWVSAEPSVKGSPLGWESPIILREMTYDVWTGEND